MQARVQKLLGGRAKYFKYKWILCRRHADTLQQAELGGSGGMLPRENFENRVAFLYSGAFMRSKKNNKIKKIIENKILEKKNNNKIK